jgi:hypothetical protein
MNTFIDFHHSLSLMVDVVVCPPDALRNEFFDASNDLHGKRVIPMRFALIDRGGFAELADAVGFMPVALYGDYDRGEYLEGTSPYMIWVLEKAKRP